MRPPEKLPVYKQNALLSLTSELISSSLFSILEDYTEKAYLRNYAAATVLDALLAIDSLDEKDDDCALAVTSGALYLQDSLFDIIGDDSSRHPSYAKVKAADLFSRAGKLISDDLVSDAIYADPITLVCAAAARAAALFDVDLNNDSLFARTEHAIRRKNDRLLARGRARAEKASRINADLERLRSRSTIDPAKLEDLAALYADLRRADT